MMEKKRMAALLAAVLFGMSAIPAGAVNLIDTDAAATDSAEHAELDLYGVRATVTDRQDGELTVSTETAGTVVVHIAEQTIIMDTQTGLPAGAQDIKKGDEVYLYCGEMMALSEPPQVYAKAILVNLTDEHEPASLLSAEQVKRNADGSLTVQASSGQSDRRTRTCKPAVCRAGEEKCGRQSDCAGKRRRPDAEHCTECVCYAVRHEKQGKT